MEKMGDAAYVQFRFVVGVNWVGNLFGCVSDDELAQVHHASPSEKAERQIEVFLGARVNTRFF